MKGKQIFFAEKSHVFLPQLIYLKVIFIGGNFPFLPLYLNTNVCWMHCSFHSLPFFFLFSLTTDDKKEKLEGWWKMCVWKKKEKKKLSTLAPRLSIENHTEKCFHVKWFLSLLSLRTFTQSAVWRKIFHIRVSVELGSDWGQRLLCFSLNNTAFSHKWRSGKSSHS